MSQISPRPILKEGKKWKVRVLRPSEYLLLRASCDQVDLLDGALYTGMRYVELQRLQKNVAWYEPGAPGSPTAFVYLPQAAILKAKRRQLNRWVKLNAPGKTAVEKLLGTRELPTWETWTTWIRKWAVDAGISPEGLGPKTTRKTWESWLAFYFGQNRLLEIVQSQGHTAGTSLHHYLSMPFLPGDRLEMKKFVQGMFDEPA